jgi:hypothetical protein
VKRSEHRHPTDDLLIALYFGDGGDGAADERGDARQHLHGCEACTWRYTELTAPLERLRQDAASEADEVFTEQRLDAQRSAIHDRLEHGARSPKVIPFPGAAATVDRAIGHRHPALRWVAAAAAAGLLLGVTASHFLDATLSGNRPAASVGTIARSRLSPGPQQVSAVYNRQAAAGDEDFLGAVDAAVGRQQIAELRALDELTPHAREGIVPRR